MAITWTLRGNAGNTSSSTTYAFSPASNFTDGTMAVLIISADNSVSGGTAQTTFTVTDSHANQWHRRLSPIYDPGAANEGVEGAVFTTRMNVATLTTGSTITITFGTASTAEVYLLYEAAAPTGYVPYYVQGGVGTGSNTTSPTVTTSSVSPGNLLVGVLHTEYGATQVITGDADATNGSWSAGDSQIAGTTTTGMGVQSQSKQITTAAGAQTFNPTADIASDNICSWFELSQIISTITWSDRGGFTNTTAGTSFNVSPGINFSGSAGSLAVIVFTVDNADTNGEAHSTFTITDSHSNTWTRRTSPINDPGADAAGVEGACFTSPMNGGTLTTGSTITVTFDATTTSKSGMIFEAGSPNGSQVIFIDGGSGDTGTGTTMTCTTGSILNGNLVIGMLHTEFGTNGSVITPDVSSTSGNWSQNQSARIGTSAAGTGVFWQSKLVTVTGTQSYSPAHSPSSDWVTAWIELGVKNIKDVISAGMIPGRRY